MMIEAAQATEDTHKLHHEELSMALSMRIPPFWRDQPQLWFFSFEAATSELGRDEARLAQILIARLEKQDIEQIEDLLYNMPKTNQYTILKKRLIDTYEESDSRRLHKLLSETKLGNQRPSHLLRRMRTLARNLFPDTTLKLIWMNNLPSYINSTLAVTTTNTELDELAVLADKIMDQAQAVSTFEDQLFTFASSNICTSCTKHAHALNNEVRKLELEIAELKATYDSRRRSASKRPQTPSYNNKPFNGYCYYHGRFGKSARNCTLPCSYNKTLYSKRTPTPLSLQDAIPKTIVSVNSIREATVANTLSQVQAITFPSTINCKATTISQKLQEQDNGIYHSVQQDNLQPKKMPIPCANRPFSNCKTSQRNLPEEIRFNSFDAARNISHLGRKTTSTPTLQMVSRSSIKTDVPTRARPCTHYQRCKMQHHMSTTRDNQDSKLPPRKSKVTPPTSTSLRPRIRSVFILEEPRNLDYRGYAIKSRRPPEEHFNISNQYDKSAAIQLLDRQHTHLSSHDSSRSHNQ